ncbi:MAG: hypothetical protein IPM54_26945 [Polyangiaceae bacterium]|nr:hypothetical protein [Polyangiaceae bacterium]
MTRALKALALLSVGLSCGCSSALAWYGHTPDRTKRIEIRQSHGKQWLVMGDQKSAEYDAIATHAFAFADGGRRTAVAALRIGKDGAQRWHVVSDFKEGPAWDGLAGLVFSPNGAHLAYAAENKKRWHVVVDGKVGPVFEWIDPASMTWSADGKRLGYVAGAGECARAVIEDNPGDCHRRVIGLSVGRKAEHDIALVVEKSGEHPARLLIGGKEAANFVYARSLHTDSTGEHWAVIAETEPLGVGYHLVVDGNPQPSFDEISAFVWAPAGKAFAYTARRDATWYAIEPRTASRPYDAVEVPVFSGDGLHVGHVGRVGAEGFVSVDGKVVWSRTGPVTALTFDTQGKRIAFMYRDAKGPVIAVDKARHHYDVVIDGSLRFSRDGRHWAALVGSLSKRKLTMIMDGEKQLPFDSEELFGGGLYKNSREAIGTWVAAELELYLGAQHGRH